MLREREIEAMKEFTDVKRKIDREGERYGE